MKITIRTFAVTKIGQSTLMNEHAVTSVPEALRYIADRAEYRAALYKDSYQIEAFTHPETEPFLKLEISEGQIRAVDFPERLWRT